jgi:outer membrane biosynthesis protein TonB
VNENQTNMAKRSTYLRCGLVWEKTLIDDRVFYGSSKVTIGESPRATFTLNTYGVGKRHCLFKNNKNGCTLFLKPGMYGKVRIDGHVREVEELTAFDAVADRKNDSIVYTLTEGDEGVLVFGQVGFTFSIAPQKTLTEPATFGQIIGHDSYTSKLFGLAMGFILLFALATRIFASAPPPFTVEQLPDRFVSFIVDDPDKVKNFKKEAKQVKEERIRKKTNPTRSKKTTSETAENNTQTDDAHTRAIKKKVSSKGLVGAIAVARKKNKDLQSLMDQGSLGISLDSAVKSLDRGSAQARVITSAGGESSSLAPGLISQRGSEQALGIGEGSRDARPATGVTGRQAGRQSRLAGRQEASVSLSMPSSAATVSGGSLSKKQISSVVMRNKGAIRYCYESQLNRYPTMRGKVVVDFIINTDGSVRTVKVPNNTLSQPRAADKVARCLMKFIKRWKFPKPKGGKVRVIYPFTFGRSK